MDLRAIRDTFDRVAKKQNVSSSKTQELIDQIIQALEQSLIKLQSVQDPAFHVSQTSAIRELNDKIVGIGAPHQLEVAQKELNAALHKYTKLLDKSFDQDISRANRSVVFDEHTVNQIIACHFYRLGLFDLGDCFVNEAKEPNLTNMKAPFTEMHQILVELKSGNLNSAVCWAASQHDRLIQNGSNLELKLHRLRFVEIVQNGTREEAVKYARTFLAPFSSLHAAEVIKLMGCLMYVGQLEKSPYTYLLAPTNREALAEEVAQQFCSLLGQSRDSPLSVVIEAGVQALPTLLKFATVMANTNRMQEWEKMKQLPVSIDLGTEFQFHSVFVCPVSREQGSDENPPMFMPCGHVLCKQSIVKLSKNSTRAFKCPYCPGEATVAQCRQLHF